MSPPRLFEQLPAKRRCGECDLCCTAVSVNAVGERWNASTTPDFQKPAQVRCQYLKGEAGCSCSIYRDRPYVCSEFACLWRTSDTLLDDRLWPARVGFVVSMNGMFGDFPPIITVNPDPAHPNAWNKNHHRREFARLARQFNGIVVIGEGDLARLIFAPSGKTYAREDHPHLFKDDGRRVGLPAEDFLPHRLSKNEIAFLIFGVAVP